MWKLYYESDVVVGRHRQDWEAAPVTGVQVLVKRLDPETDGKSRVGWYTDDEYQRYYHDNHFYLWQDDGPAGVTPDAVLAKWAAITGDTSVRIADLSLDELHSIGAKCGESLPNEQFNEILQRALNDPTIP